MCEDIFFVSHLTVCLCSQAPLTIMTKSTDENKTTEKLTPQPTCLWVQTCQLTTNVQDWTHVHLNLRSQFGVNSNLKSHDWCSVTIFHIKSVQLLKRTFKIKHVKIAFWVVCKFSDIHIFTNYETNVVRRGCSSELEQTAESAHLWKHTEKNNIWHI